MAGAYHAKNYVIGPQLYAPFWMTIRGVLLFMGFLYVLAFLLSWGEATQSIGAFLDTIWEWAVSFIEDLLRNFSIIFVIFIILDRILPEQDWMVQLKAWDTVSNTPSWRGCSAAQLREPGNPNGKNPLNNLTPSVVGKPSSRSLSSC